MTDVEGRVVLVTGAASGMGRLLARGLAARGARTVLWDVDEAGLAATVQEIRDEGGEATGRRCDVGDRAAVAAAAAEVSAAVGPVEVLVNNAGVVHGRPLLDLTDDQIERTFRVNTLAHFWTVRAFLPAMVARDSGHVVTMASVVGLAGSPRLVDYTASKSAVIGFHQALRLELACSAPSVRTTLVLPYLVSTGMFAGARSRYPRLFPVREPEAAVARILRAVERDEQRLMVPAVAHVARFLSALPPRAGDRFLEVAGFNAAMDHFVGREGSRC